MGKASGKSRAASLCFITALFAALSCGAPDRVRQGGAGGAAPPSGDGCVTRECHSSVLSAPFLHTPVEEQPCAFCHSTVAVDHLKSMGMEFVVPRGQTVACVECHARTEPRPAYSHKPYAMDGCRECHEVHGSTIRPLMKRDINGLCSYCHRDVAARIESCKVTHGAVSEGTCVDTCHDPHEADRPRLLRRDKKDLCTECHDTGPGCGAGGENSCLDCHFVHAGNRPGMLRDGVK